MSVTQVHPNTPTPTVPIWIVTVIVIVILAWPAIGRTAGALTDTLSLVAALTAGGYLPKRSGHKGLIRDAFGNG